MTNTLQFALMLVFTISTQSVGAALLPRTEGFTQPFWSVACLAMFGLGIWMMARMAQAGIALSVMIPLLSALGPLTAIAIGVLIYGESASAMRVLALLAACGLIGWASQIN